MTKYIMKSVGLIIFTEIPDIGLVAVLRERGWFNFEKMQLELYYGGYQPVVHGKLEARENFTEALYREMAEELGVEFAKYFTDSVEKGDLKIIEAYNLRNDEKNVVTFVSKIESNYLKKIRLSVDGGALRFIRKDEIGDIVGIDSLDKNTGALNRNRIAMFKDEKEALIKGFEYF